MPKTRKTLQPKNLAKYDVLIEDTSASSVYFQISNLPPLFSGGRNSFLIAGSSLLKPQSNIQIEILDAGGNSIYQNPIEKYLEGNSRLISVEVSEEVTAGFATIIILGQAAIMSDGTPIPPNWQNSYNVRWVKQILIEPNRRNTSPLILKNTPSVFSEERRLYSVDTSSYTSSSVVFTASLSPTLYSGFQVGYVINAESPTTFSADYSSAYITGSLIINGVNADLYVPISDILNQTTAFSSGQLIKTSDKRIIDKIYLFSGSYSSQVLAETVDITSSATLIYNKLNVNNLHIPVSYAKLRIVDLNTVSGEIYKFKVYSKVSTNYSDYKLVADVPVTTSELLITSSIRGDLPIGDFNISPTASLNWYSSGLETSSNSIYTISGSTMYYDATAALPTFSLSVADNILLRSIQAEIPIYNNQQYDGYVSQSGYFIGNRQSLTLFPTTEYTLQLDAVYKKISGSVNLVGITPKVDIYVIGTSGTKIVDNNPLGQKIGTLKVVSGTETQWYQDQTFNFIPALANSGSVGIRFVVSNGLWYFSEISLKPASDKLFSPDEVQLLVPNTEYHNEYLQHKIEFFDINNNSTEVSVVSVPTFFTGSNIDMGILP
jgi:hypothetical protein